MTEEESAEIIGQAVLHSEFAFSKISEQEYNTDGLQLAFSEEAIQHMNVLLNNWNNLRPLLEPFATANLAPLKK